MIRGNREEYHVIYVSLSAISTMKFKKVQSRKQIGQYCCLLSGMKNTDQYGTKYRRGDL